MTTEMTVHVQDAKVDHQDDIVFQGKICLLLSHASKNNTAGMLDLFASGVSPNAADYDKRTALHLACSDGAFEAAKLLIDKGCDVNPVDRFGKTPLDDAMEFGDSHIINFIRDNDGAFGSREKLQGDLIQCSSTGDIAKARKLLESGVNVNAADYDKRTALHLAVANDNVEMAKLLLEFKADPNIEDRFGLTPYLDMKRHKTRTGVDHMKTVFDEVVTPEHTVNPCSTFVGLFSVFQVVFIIIYFTVAEYADVGKKPIYNVTSGKQLGKNNIKDVYSWFQDIHVMIFIGFGFLMTFLKKNVFSAVGYTFLISTFCIQWYIIIGSVLEHAIVSSEHSSEPFKIKINIEKLVFADFSAAAVLISYGACLGKITPMQLSCMATVEIVLYAVNEAIGISLGVHDIGGSMVIHMFGAYFGMGVSIMMNDKDNKPNNVNNASVYHSDLFAMIGTVFLWMYWPSFNAGPSLGDYQQHRAVINTLLSLSGSCFTAFMASYYFRKERKFNMVDIQNATLAGGVAMGAAADLMIGPGAALIIGCMSGFLSVVGYVYVQPRLEHSLGYMDTCGINNLHGMPSILGALAAVIAARVIKQSEYVSPTLGGNDTSQLEAIYSMVASGERTEADQALYQLAYIGITLVISFLGGSLTGFLIKQTACDPYKTDTAFLDSTAWEVPDMEFPYYFDERGEIASHGAEDKTVHGGPGISDPASAQKVKAIEAAMEDLKKSFRQHRNAVGTPQFPYMPVPMPMQAPAAPAGTDLELKLMVSKLINKMDEQALHHRDQLNWVMQHVGPLAARTASAGATDKKAPDSPSASLKYVY